MRLDILTVIRANASPRRPATAMLPIRAVAWLAALMALFLPASRGATAELPWCAVPAQEEDIPRAREGLSEAGLTSAEEGHEPGLPPASCGERDVWSVITRGLPEIGRMPQHARPAVESLDARGCWRKTNLNGLLSTPGQPLLVFVHGNRYDHDSAREQGLLLASRTRVTSPSTANVRTVIFSWPSDKQGILLRDSRVKYERAVTEGHYLAWLLSQVEPDRPVAIVGYSYGALIALEALEDLVQAEAAGRSDVRSWTNRSAPLHLVLVAAAVRQDAFAPRGPYREILPCIDRLTILSNSSDIALRFFEHVDRSLRTEALGNIGMPAAWIPRGIEFGQVDCAEIVGPSHRLKHYLNSPLLMRRICSAAGRGLYHDACPTACLNGTGSDAAEAPPVELSGTACPGNR